MPRIARAVAPGCPHHVTQRGNFGFDIFDDEDDRRRYLEWLGDYAQRYGVAFWAYCLMANHVHFIAVPNKEDSLAKVFNHAHRRHSLAINRKRGQTGHLWQGRFFSCALDKTHLHDAVRYVERNPVRAGLVNQAEAYRWSSAAAHVKRLPDALLSGDDILKQGDPDWRQWLSEPEADFAEQLRVSTRTGRPIGPADFVKNLESQLNRSLVSRPVGRPRKKAKGIIY